MPSLQKIQEDLLRRSGVIRKDHVNEKVERDVIEMFRDCLKEVGYNHFNRPQFDNAYNYFKRFYKKVYPNEIHNPLARKRVCQFIEYHEEHFNRFLGERLKEQSEVEKEDR